MLLYDSSLAYPLTNPLNSTTAAAAIDLQPSHAYHTHRAPNHRFATQSSSDASAAAAVVAFATTATATAAAAATPNMMPFTPAQHAEELPSQESLDAVLTVVQN